MEGTEAKGSSQGEWAGPVATTEGLVGEVFPDDGVVSSPGRLPQTPYNLLQFERPLRTVENQLFDVPPMLTTIVRRCGGESLAAPA